MYHSYGIHQAGYIFHHLQLEYCKEYYDNHGKSTHKPLPKSVSTS